MLYTELVKIAMCVALEVHREQYDKNGFPYIHHPFHLAEQVGDDEKAIVVALLHDVLEDSDFDESYLLSKGIPVDIVETIVCLTRKNDESYFEYIERVSGNSLATKIKLLDLEHNMRENCPTSLYKRYSKAHRMLETKLRNQYKQQNSCIPMYLKEKDVWCVETDKRLAYGSIAYVISEFCGDSCIYKFKLGNQEEHEHSFESVLAVLVNNAEIFSIEDHMDCYSNQERRVLMNAKNLILQKKNKEEVIT